MKQEKATNLDKKRKRRVASWALAAALFVFAFLCYIRLRPVLMTRLLIHAIKQGNLADTKLALDEGANPNALIGLASGWDGASFEESDVDLLEALLGKQMHHSVRQTPLLLATLEGRDAIAQLLVAHGADVRFKDSVGSTALQWAAHSCDAATVRLLIARGADVNSRWKDGTPVVADASGRSEIITILKQAGAKE